MTKKVIKIYVRTNKNFINFFKILGGPMSGDLEGLGNGSQKI